MLTTTIANGASLSSAIDLSAAKMQNGTKASLFALILPAGTTGSVLSFKVSADGVDYYDLEKTDGTEHTETVGAVGRAHNVDYVQFARWAFLKVRTGVSATPTVQGAAREISLMFGQI